MSFKQKVMNRISELGSQGIEINIDANKVSHGYKQELEVIADIETPRYMFSCNDATCVCYWADGETSASEKWEALLDDLSSVVKVSEKDWKEYEAREQ